MSERCINIEIKGVYYESRFSITTDADRPRWFFGHGRV